MICPLSPKTDDTKESEPPAESKKRKSESVESGDAKRQNVDSEDNTKVYVRGLPWRATEEEVRDYFAACGEISSIELPLQDDGRSSGTAIIEFEGAEAAAAAIEMNGADFNGRWLNSEQFLHVHQLVSESKSPYLMRHCCPPTIKSNTPQPNPSQAPAKPPKNKKDAPPSSSATSPSKSTKTRSARHSNPAEKSPEFALPRTEKPVPSRDLDTLSLWRVSLRIRLWRWRVVIFWEGLLGLIMQMRGGVAVVVGVEEAVVVEAEEEVSTADVNSYYIVHICCLTSTQFGVSQEDTWVEVEEAAEDAAEAEAGEEEVDLMPQKLKRVVVLQSFLAIKSRLTEKFIEMIVKGFSTSIITAGV